MLPVRSTWLGGGRDLVKAGGSDLLTQSLLVEGRDPGTGTSAARMGESQWELETVSYGFF